jgi:hypothetical protein
VCVCVCVSLIVIKRNNSSLYLKRIGRMILTGAKLSSRRKDLSQCHLDDHKFYMGRSAIETEMTRLEARDYLPM